MNREPASGDLTQHLRELEGVLDRVEQATTHYQMLGLDKSATSDEIVLAQKRTMAVLNPRFFDGEPLPASVARQMKRATDKVIQAYMVLNNFGSRVEYDNSLVRRTPVPIPFNLDSIVPKKPGSAPVVQSRVAVDTIAPAAPPARAT